MVPLTYISGELTASENDPELKLIRQFLFDEHQTLSGQCDYNHKELLQSVSNNDKETFIKCLDGFKGRKVSQQSPWCYDDSLIFLLLLGSKKFKVEANVITEILRARHSSVDSSDITQTFADINENSYSIELPYDFLKVVFCWLQDKTTMDRQAAGKCYTHITAPNFFNRLSPFLRLVALRAYELTLFHRKPQKHESFEDLVVSMRKFQKGLSIRQLGIILMLLPHKWLLSTLAVICVLLPWGISNLDFIFDYWHQSPN